MKDLELFSVITSEGEVVVGLHASPPPYVRCEKPIKMWFTTLELRINKFVNYPFLQFSGLSGSKSGTLK